MNCYYIYVSRKDIMKSKKVVIPDRVFHKMWSLALESEDFTQFYNKITNTNSVDFINLNKYGFSLDLIYDTLSMVYNNSKLTVSDLLNKYGMKKAALSHRFCIPIRTVENWCNGSGKCSPYIIIMIMEGCGIPYLPELVLTQSQYDIKYSSISSKNHINKTKNKKINNNLKNKDENIKLPLDDIDDLLDNINLEGFSIKDFEQTHLIDNSVFLSETDYLRKHMK